MRRRRGLTLIETLVAIVIASGVLLIGRSMLDAIGDGAQRLAAAARVQDRERGGDALLRSILAQARPLSPDSIAFLGGPRSMFVRSFCPVAGGWSEPCDVELSVSDTVPLLAIRIGGAPGVVIVRSSRDSIVLRYLGSAVDGGRWLTHWPVPSELPLAIGLVAEGDTVIMPLGR